MNASDATANLPAPAPASDRQRAMASVQVASEGAVRVLSFARGADGNVPFEVVRAYFAGSMLDHTHGWHRLAIDLGGVGTLDSAALGPLVQKLREVQANGGKLVLTGVEAPALREIFALTRFDRVFPILPTRALAIAAAAG
jgi:anti-anti-sigma factor